MGIMDHTPPRNKHICVFFFFNSTDYLDSTFAPFCELRILVDIGILKSCSLFPGIERWSLRPCRLYFCHNFKEQWPGFIFIHKFQKLSLSGSLTTCWKRDLYFLCKSTLYIYPSIYISIYIYYLFALKWVQKLIFCCCCFLWWTVQWLSDIILFLFFLCCSFTLFDNKSSELN